MNALTEKGSAVLTAAIALAIMTACFVYGIPGLGAALVGFLFGCFALEFTFSTHRGFLPSLYLAVVCVFWSLLGAAGLYLNALHWL